ncbi:hypothetical protein, partial [Pseudomonas aeruginosa]
ALDRSWGSEVPFLPGILGGNQWTLKASSGFGWARWLLKHSPTAPARLPIGFAVATAVTESLCAEEI